MNMSFSPYMTRVAKNLVVKKKASENALKNREHRQSVTYFDIYGLHWTYFTDSTECRTASIKKRTKQ